MLSTVKKHLSIEDDINPSKYLSTFNIAKYTASIKTQRMHYFLVRAGDKEAREQELCTYK